MDGGMRGDRSQKRLRPRKGIEGAQKKLGRPYGYQGNGGGSPARKDYRLRLSRCCRRHLRAQGTPEAYGKVGNGKDAKE